MSNRNVRALLGTGLLVYLAWGALYVWRTSFEVDDLRVFCLWDDAMISMRYARNLAEGDGLVWNAGAERVQGFSNLGVTLAMAAVQLLPLSSTLASLPFQLLNLALLGAIALLVFDVAARLHPETPWIARGAALGTALCAPLASWSLQGGDAGFEALWLLGALALIVRAGPSWSPGLIAWLAAGLLIRADAPRLYLVFAALSLAFPGRRIPRFAALLVTLIAIEGALLAWSALYYGDPLPNTYYLKLTGAPRSLVLATGLQQLTLWLPHLAPAALLAAAGVVSAPRRAPAALLGALVAAALAYSVGIGGDWVHEYGNRFVAPCLPALLILASAGCWSVLEQLVPGVLRSRLGTPLVFVPAMLGVGFWLNPPAAAMDWLDPRAPPLYRATNQANFLAGRYLRDHTARSTTIAVHWGGVPPYFSERIAFDVLGKSDRHIAKLATPVFAPGHSKWDWEYVLGELRPDVLLEATRGIEQRRDFLEQYYAAFVPDPPLRFFVRRSALGKLEDSHLRLLPLVNPS